MEGFDKGAGGHSKPHQNPLGGSRDSLYYEPPKAHSIFYLGFLESQLASQTYGKSKLSMKSKVPARMDGDGRFLSSFGQYIKLIVEESCREVKGETLLPKPELYRAGRTLVEESLPIDKIAADVEALVREVDDLVEFDKLTPKRGKVPSTPSGMSIYGVWETLNGLEEYFEGIGLAFYAGVDDFNGRKIIDVCLGEAQKAGPPGRDEVVVFTKTLIERTRDKIENTTSDWVTDSGKIYHMLEPKLDAGRSVWSKLKRGRAGKLQELAWSRLFSESDGQEEFIKKYAALCIGDNYLHEVYHSRIVGRRYLGPPEEAAAELYRISRGENPIQGLLDLYEWKDDDFPLKEYRTAAELAFMYLKKAGYRKSSWKKLEPEGPGLDEVVLALRAQAEAALTALERERKMKDHGEAEKRLGIGKNYGTLNAELERMILAK